MSPASASATPTMRRWPPASPRSCSIRLRSRRSTCAAAGPAPARMRCCIPESTVEAIDGIALSGGSALGLDAAGGVQAWLAEQGRGFRIRDAVIPIVPGAICFDLLNGGNKAWGRFPPYRDLGYAAACAASDGFRAGQRRRRPRRDDSQFQGRARLGFGADRRRRHRRRARGGQCRRQRDRRRRAVVLGGAVRDRTTNSADADCRRRSRLICCRARLKGGPAATSAENTTLVVVVTDAVLTKSQAKRLAMIAQTGMARAIYPVHAPTDGDVVFAAATGKKPVDPLVRPHRTRDGRRQYGRARNCARRP